MPPDGFFFRKLAMGDFEELDLRVLQLDKHSRHAVVWLSDLA
jgi:hypothetical protein